MVRRCIDKVSRVARARGSVWVDALIHARLEYSVSNHWLACTRTQRDGAEYAVKIFRKTRLSLIDVTGLLEEVSILAHVRHRNVIGFVDFVEDPWYYYLVTELVRGGELFDRITAKVRPRSVVGGRRGVSVCLCVGALVDFPWLAGWLAG